MLCLGTNRKSILDSRDSALRQISPARLPASHCLPNSKQKVGQTQSPDLLGRLGFTPRRGTGRGRKPPIQLSSEELEQSSQKDVAEEAEGSTAVGDELCERGVGEVANSTKIRLEPSLSNVSGIRLKSSNRLRVPGAGCLGSTCTRAWKLQSICCSGFL